MIRAYLVDGLDVVVFARERREVGRQSLGRPARIRLRRLVGLRNLFDSHENGGRLVN